MENSKKIAKKFNISKKYQYCNISGENRLEKDVNEIKTKFSFRSFPSRPVLENSKKRKKIQKIKKYHYGFISSHNRLEKDEK